MCKTTVLALIALLPVLAACAATSGGEGRDGEHADRAVETGTLEQTRQEAGAADISTARLAVAEALTEARAVRAELFQRAMAAPVDSPLRPTLADRAERLKRLERDLVAARSALEAARVPAAPAEVVRQAVVRARAAATRLRTQAARMAP